MTLSSLVFRKAATSTGWRFKCWNLVRKALILLAADPVCRLSVHGKLMNINLSHELPIYQSLHPCYDTLPGRLAKFIRLRSTNLVGIDVGANIGDSLAAFLGSDFDRFLAVEPNPKFFGILRSNWKDDPRVVLTSVLCSANSDVAKVLVVEQRGTATMIKSAVGNGMPQRSIDDMATEFGFLANCNLIKVDTDGHDFEVLDGAVKLIKKNQPAILFECDIFGRTNYVQRVSETLHMLQEAGYAQILIYDNFGFLMGRSSLSDLDHFKQLLFYQLTSAFNYFDILVLPNQSVDAFYRAEVEFFTNKCVEPKLIHTACTAALV